MKKLTVLIILLVIGVLGFNLMTYTVAEDEVAVVKTFGNMESIVITKGDMEKVMTNLEYNNKSDINVSDTKGLHFRIPFIQTIEKYTAKYLTYISSPETINTRDQREIDIQMYAQYRIVDPAKFNVSLGSKTKVNNTMDNRVYPVVIQSANTLQFNEFFDKEKISSMIETKKAQLNDELMKEFGIYVTDIGINRKNFPMTNIQSIEEKMSKEIEKESQKLRAEGDSEYQKAVSAADRERKVLVAQAIEEAATVKAAADAEALNIYQKSLQKDLEFYRFIQRMDTYKNLKDTTIFMDKDNDFLKYLNGY